MKSFKITITELKKIAKEKGGTFVRGNPENCHSPLVFSCRKLHPRLEWTTSYNRVVHVGNWCPDQRCILSRKAKSGNLKKTREDSINELKKLGLTLENPNTLRNENTMFNCSKGHSFQSTIRKVLRAKECPVCKTTKRGKDLSELCERFASLHKGELFSSPFAFNSLKDSQIWFQCSKGHIFKKDYMAIRNNQWCPECFNFTFNKKENAIRLFFEKVFQVSFPRIRPDETLNGLTGRRLEIDGYNRDLNIGFEHQGLFHYKLIPFFDTETSFKDRQERDQLKREMLKKAGWRVIEIPEIGRITKKSEFKEFIKSQLEKFEIEVPPDYDLIELEWSDSFF